MIGGHGFVWSNTAIFASLVLSCLFLPSFLAKILTVKWMMVFGMFCYTIYISIQIYPTLYTIIAGGIIFGIGAATMWTAKCIYLAKVLKYVNIIKIE